MICYFSQMCSKLFEMIEIKNSSTHQSQQGMSTKHETLNFQTDYAFKMPTFSSESNLKSYFLTFEKLLNFVK